MPGLDYGIDFYVGLAREAKGPVLDIACVTGRALLPVLQARVDGDGMAGLITHGEPQKCEAESYRAHGDHRVEQPEPPPHSCHPCEGRQRENRLRHLFGGLASQAAVTIPSAITIISTATKIRSGSNNFGSNRGWRSHPWRTTNRGGPSASRAGIAL